MKLASNLQCLTYLAVRIKGRGGENWAQVRWKKVGQKIMNDEAKQVLVWSVAGWMGGCLGN